MIPTPDEIAAMAPQQRRAAIVGIDFNSMAYAEQKAYVEAVMAEAPPVPRADTPPHIRTRIPFKRGNGFYRPTYGESENGSRTLCNAEAGLDYTWLEGRGLGEKPVCPECKTIRAEQQGPRR